MNFIKDANALETIFLGIIALWIIGFFISLPFRRSHQYWNGTGDTVAVIWRNAWQGIIGIVIGYILFKRSIPIMFILVCAVLLWLAGFFISRWANSHQQYQNRSRTILRNTWQRGWQYIVGAAIGYFLSGPWFHTSLSYW